MSTPGDELAIEWRGEDVSPTTVERALDRLLQQLTPPAPEGHRHPLARASVLNLVVHATESFAEARAVEALGQLAERHPSRTLVVVADPIAPAPGLDASATVHCRRRPELEGRVCFEQVRLTVRGEAASYLSSVVAPLLIPDLPVVLWWLGDAPEPDEPLIELADQLIVDSHSFGPGGPGGPGGLDRLSRLVVALHDRTVIRDLAWSALSPWRELLAQLFDALEARPYQRGLTSVRLDYASGSSSVQPLLLLGWLAASLGWTPEAPAGSARSGALQFRRPGGAVDVVVNALAPPDAFSPGELMAVVLTGRHDGRDATFEIARHDDGACATLRLALPGQAEARRIVPLARQSLATLLGRELDRVAGDPTYRASVAVAGRVALP